MKLLSFEKHKPGQMMPDAWIYFSPTPEGWVLRVKFPLFTLRFVQDYCVSVARYGWYVPYFTLGKHYSTYEFYFGFTFHSRLMDEPEYWRLNESINFERRC